MEYDSVKVVEVPSDYILIDYEGEKTVIFAPENTYLDDVKVIRRLTVPSVLSFLRQAVKEGMLK